MNNSTAGNNEGIIGDQGVEKFKAAYQSSFFIGEW
jgi:hypothetical protein